MTRAALRIVNSTHTTVSLRITMDGCLLSRLSIQARGGQLILQRGDAALEATIALQAPFYHSISPRYRIETGLAHLVILERQQPQASPCLDVCIERSSSPDTFSAENATAHPALITLHLPLLNLPLQLVVAPSSSATLRLLAPLSLTAFSQGVASDTLDISSQAGTVEIRQRPDLSLDLLHTP